MRSQLQNLLLILCLILVAACTHSNPSVTTQNISFVAAGNTLSGTLIMPKNTNTPLSTLIFVHGDGSINYEAYGYYIPIWQKLTSKGIAVFSWDKPGVGRSSGNWHMQTMENRAQEIVEAFKVLKLNGHNNIGVIGFSQAGWVLPLLSDKNINPDYMIFISTAINWLEQSKYLTQKRLKKLPIPKKELIKLVNKEESAFNALLQKNASYEEYLSKEKSNKSIKSSSPQKPLPKDRYLFIKRNWKSDSLPYLKDIKAPTLLLFGEEDLNIAVKENAEIYRKEFSKSSHTDFTIKIFPNATHALTKASYFNQQSPGLFSITLINLLGDDVFAENVLDYITSWTIKRVNR